MLFRSGRPSGTGGTIKGTTTDAVITGTTSGVVSDTTQVTLEDMTTATTTTTTTMSTTTVVSEPSAASLLTNPLQCVLGASMLWSSLVAAAAADEECRSFLEVIVYRDLANEVTRSGAFNSNSVTLSFGPQTHTTSLIVPGRPFVTSDDTLLSTPLKHNTVVEQTSSGAPTTTALSNEHDGCATNARVVTAADRKSVV